MIDDIIVDMESPTPLDLYRYSSSGTVDIRISKNSSRYSLHIDDSSLDNPIVLTNMSKSMLQTWELIEMFREKAFQENKVVNVHDEFARTSYKRITLATTLSRLEKAEALERQAKRMASTRRRMVVDNTYHKRKGRLLDPRIVRPILREEKTW
tara:strand:- start:888 stop:1346 length:459 start_codon:yes stop_codon:yes gene_type:complete